MFTEIWWIKPFGLKEELMKSLRKCLEVEKQMRQMKAIEATCARKKDEKDGVVFGERGMS